MGRIFGPVALAALAATATLALGGTATAAHEDCAMSVEAPASYYGIATITSAQLDCATAKNTIRIWLVLTRDGVDVAASNRTCHKSATCWTYLVEDDPPGDQVYCTRFSARVGSHWLAPSERCEADPAL